MVFFQAPLKRSLLKESKNTKMPKLWRLSYFSGLSLKKISVLIWFHYINFSTIWGYIEEQNINLLDLFRGHIPCLCPDPGTNILNNFSRLWTCKTYTVFNPWFFFGGALVFLSTSFLSTVTDIFFSWLNFKYILLSPDLQIWLTKCVWTMWKYCWPSSAPSSIIYFFSQSPLVER